MATIGGRLPPTLSISGLASSLIRHFRPHQQPPDPNLGSRPSGLGFALALASGLGALALARQGGRARATDSDRLLSGAPDERVPDRNRGGPHQDQFGVWGARTDPLPMGPPVVGLNTSQPLANTKSDRKLDGLRKSQVYVLALAFVCACQLAAQSPQHPNGPLDIDAD